MATSEHPEALSGPALLGGLATILILAFFEPPVAAIFVNRLRIDRASVETQQLAEMLHERGLTWLRATGFGNAWSGTGRVPEATSMHEWVTGGVTLWPHDFVAPGPDPWGNQYLVNRGVTQTGQTAEPFAVWVLSAGPNGLIETPYAAPAVSAALGGDDIGARIE